MTNTTNSITITLNIVDAGDSINKISVIFNGNPGKEATDSEINLIIRKCLHELLCDMDTFPENWSSLETASPDSQENQDQPYPF